MFDLSTITCWFCLIFSSGFFYKLYDVFDFLLDKCFNKYSTYDKDRQAYILTNILKSFYLVIITLIFIFNLATSNINLLNTALWYKHTIFWKSLVAMYASTDLVGLVLNKKMSVTTIIHHYGVIIGFIIISFKDFKDEGIYKAIFIYGCFSALAFIVNFYLGFRFLTHKKGIIKHIVKKLAFVNYLLVIVFNISWQFYYFVTTLISLSLFNNIFLIVLVTLWLKDDLILLKFLYN
jgi:hypothetical protein